jgi:hypothetical protein
MTLISKHHAKVTFIEKKKKRKKEKKERIRKKN